MKNSGAANSPFLKIIIPAAAGVVLARAAAVPVWVAVAAFAVVFLCAVAVRRQSAVYLWFSILLFFFAVSAVAAPRSAIPQGVRVEVVVQIAENPHVRGRWQNTTAQAGYYRPANDSAAGWTRVNERVQLSIDTCYDVTVGRQLAFRGWLNPVDTTGSSYGRLMHLRGLFGRMYVTPGNLIRTAPHVSRTPVYHAARLQRGAIERLSRLDMDTASRAVVTAMTAGDKRDIDRELGAGYRLTGATHLLSVSGLHVGIVFVLVNLLLYLLPAFRRGHIYKNIAAMIAIWFFAAMAGLAPSVVRAALMFSFAQAAIASGSYRNGLNIMLGSAVVMLAINPNYAGDPSFMLSYAAVLAITVFFNPLFSFVRTRYKIINAITSIIVIGVVATLGTAPLIAYWFGNLALIGMVINPLVIFTANIIVIFGVLWVIAPLGFLNPLFSWILGLAIAVQNGVVEWSASLIYASVAVKLPIWGLLAIYAGYIVLAVWLYNRPYEKEFKLR